LDSPAAIACEFQIRPFLASRLINPVSAAALENWPQPCQFRYPQHESEVMRRQVIQQPNPIAAKFRIFIGYQADLELQEYYESVAIGRSLTRSSHIPIVRDFDVRLPDGPRRRCRRIILLSNLEL
jgi:hypothetical protein